MELRAPHISSKKEQSQKINQPHGVLVNSNKVERPCDPERTLKLNLHQPQPVVCNLTRDNVNVMSLGVGADFRLICRAAQLISIFFVCILNRF